MSYNHVPPQLGSPNFLSMTNSMLMDDYTYPQNSVSYNTVPIQEEEQNMLQEEQNILQEGSGKTKKKSVKKPKPKSKPKAKPKKDAEKKVKEIDTYKKDKLVKIAKKHDVSLKARDGKVKTKEQLFNSLKRKKII
jgi:hypothetical protein